MTVPVEHCLLIVQFWTTIVRYCLPGILSFFNYGTGIAFFSHNIFHLFIELHQELLFDGHEM